MIGRTLIAVLILGICAAVFLMLDIPRDKNDALITPAHAAPAITARDRVIEGRAVGEVVMGSQVVFRIRSAAGGLSPFQRAQVVAHRLELLTGNLLQPEDIATGRVRGQDVVLAEEELVITADSTHARLNRTTPTRLAQQWAGNLKAALEGRPISEKPAVEEPPAEEPVVEEPPAEAPVAEKLVPIISVGDGTRVGAALVSGPSDKVRDVNAVAQIEGTFGTAVRGRVLVPVATEDVIQRISRVPQTSVTALVDIRL